MASAAKVIFSMSAAMVPFHLGGEVSGTSVDRFQSKEDREVLTSPTNLHTCVILQVCPNAGKIEHNGDTCTLEERGRSNTTSMKHRRGAKSSSRQDHLAFDRDVGQLSSVQRFDLDKGRRSRFRIAASGIHHPDDLVFDQQVIVEAGVCAEGDRVMGDSSVRPLSRVRVLRDGDPAESILGSPVTVLCRRLVASQQLDPRLSNRGRVCPLKRRKARIDGSLVPKRLHVPGETIFGRNLSGRREKCNALFKVGVYRVPGPAGASVGFFFLLL